MTNYSVQQAAEEVMGTSQPSAAVNLNALKIL